MDATDLTRSRNGGSSFSASALAGSVGCRFAAALIVGSAEVGAIMCPGLVDLRFLLTL